MGWSGRPQNAEGAEKFQISKSYALKNIPADFQFIHQSSTLRQSLSSLASLLSVRKFRTARQRASYPKEIFPLEIVLRHHHHIHDSSKKIQSLATLVKCHFHGFSLKKKNTPSWRFWRFSVAILAKNPANSVILAIFRS